MSVSAEAVNTDDQWKENIFPISWVSRTSSQSGVGQIAGFYTGKLLGYHPISLLTKTTLGAFFQGKNIFECV